MAALESLTMLKKLYGNKFVTVFEDPNNMELFSELEAIVGNGAKYGQCDNKRVKNGTSVR